MMEKRQSGGATMMMAQAVAKIEKWKLNLLFVFGLLGAGAIILWFVTHAHEEGTGHTIPGLIFSGGALVLCFFAMMPVPMSKLIVFVGGKIGKKK